MWFYEIIKRINEILKVKYNLKIVKNNPLVINKFY